MGPDLSSTAPHTNQSKSIDEEDKISLPPIATNSDQLGSTSSESRDRESVSDVWNEFFRLYRHPFGRTDSMFQKTARMWLKKLNKGDPEYICEQCTIQPGYRMGCDRKNIRCQLCVERHRVCSRTKTFKKRMIMEKLRLNEKEYDDLAKLVPPRRRGAHAPANRVPDSGTLLGTGTRIFAGPQLQSSFGTTLKMASPVSKTSTPTSVLTKSGFKRIYKVNLNKSQREGNKKGKGVDGKEYGNGSGNGHRRRKKRPTPIFSSSSGSYFSPSNIASDSDSDPCSYSKVESQSEMEVESEDDEDELEHDEDVESDSNKENKNITLACVGRKRPAPQNITNAGDASTSKIRTEDLATEADTEAAGSRRASKRIRTQAINSPVQGRRPQSTTTTQETPKIPVGYPVGMIRAPLGDINVQPTVSGSAEIKDYSKGSTPQPLLSGGIDSGVEVVQCAESEVDLQVQVSPLNISTETVLQQQKQIMETLRSVESTLNVIRESLEVSASKDAVVESSSIGQGAFNGLAEDNHSIGVKELTGMVTTRETLELLEASQHWKLFINSPQGPDDDDHMVLDDEIVGRK